MKHFIFTFLFFTVCHSLSAQIFFTENFDTISSPNLPLNWTVSTQSTDGGYSTGDSSDANQNGTWLVPSHNQFAMTNDDVCNCNKSDDYLILPVQDFSSVTGGINLEAEIFHDAGFGGKSHLMVSIDTGNNWLAVDTFSGSNNWQNVMVNLNAFIGVQHLLIAFHFSDGGFWTTGLAVDDVVLRQVSGFNDLIALSPNQEYSQIPRSQVWNIPLTAKIKNQGSSTAFNAVLSTEVYKSPDFITPLQSFSGIGDTIIPTQIKTLSSGNYQPLSRGSYLFRHIVSTTSFMDGNTSNDTTDFWFEVTDSVYARDNNSLDFSIDNPGFANTIEVGQVFDVNLTATLTSITFATEGANTGDTATLSLYNTVAGYPSTLINAFDYAFSAKGVQYITIPANVVLPPGTYFLSVKENSMTDTLGILASDNIYSDGKSFLSLNGGSFVDMASQGYPAAIILRPNLNVPCPAMAVNTTQIACYGDSNGVASITLSGGMPPFSYNWSTSDSTLTVSDLSAGTFYVTITDANNCTASDSAVIVEPLQLIAVDTSLTSRCSDSCTGAAFSLPSGGTLPYFYQWDANAYNSISYDVQALCPGVYQCTVTDFRGCSVLMNSEVFLFSPVDSITKTDASSSGVNDGTAFLHFSDSSWVFSWSTGDSSPFIDSLNAGWYYVTATDTSGCIYIDSVEIGDNSLLNLFTSFSDNSLKVYPNPSNGLFVLELLSDSNEDVAVSIYNSTGQYIRQFFFTGRINSLLFLDLSEFTASVYFAKIQIGKRSLLRKLILKK